MTKPRSLRRMPISAAILALAIPGLARAHAERPAFYPEGRVAAAPAYRPLVTDGDATPQSPRRVVCKRAGDEGVAAGEETAVRIERVADEVLREINRSLLAECAFEHVQQAVDAVDEPGTTIYVLPGIYLEQASLRALTERFGAADPSDTEFCRAVVERVDATNDPELSYEEQFRCPHVQNTIAIFGDANFVDDDCGPADGFCDHPETISCDPGRETCRLHGLQIEGTGAKITDVVIEGAFLDAPGEPEDGQFTHLNGIRADRVDAIYFRNFTVQKYEFNALYVIESDGYVIDRILARWNDEYGFLTFSADHGLYTDCEAYGNADSGLYPGSGADLYPAEGHAGVDLRARHSVEIRRCKSHHNTLGYSGTAGNAVWVHDTDFYLNQTGVATDSLFPDHPGLPQDHALFEANRIYANNVNYVGRFVQDRDPDDGIPAPCSLPPRDRGLVTENLDEMVVCPVVPVPVGTGLMIAGGNVNRLEANEVFDNWRHGFMTFGVPAAFRNEPDKGLDTSHFNRFLDNRMGRDLATGARQPNGTDLWWDEGGDGNCFLGNVGPDGGAATSDPILLPPTLTASCPDLGPLGPNPLLLPNPVKLALTLAPCADYSRERNPSPNLGDTLASLVGIDNPLPIDVADCSFFDDPPPPASREARREVSVLEPPGRMLAGDSGLVGSVRVFNGGTEPSEIRSVTIAIDRPELFENLVVDLGGRRATASDLGPSTVFVFEPPVVMPPLGDRPLRIEAEGSGGTTSAGANRALAAMGGGTLVLAGLAGMRRRRALGVLALAAACAAAGVGACGDGNGSSRSERREGSATGTTRLVLADVEASDDVYEGLPLSLGVVEIATRARTPHQGM